VFYYRLHVSTYLQVIFWPFDKIVRNCYTCWDLIMFTRIKYEYVKYIKCLCKIHKVFMLVNRYKLGMPFLCC